MIDLDAANLLLELTNKQSLKRPMPNVGEQPERNKRQKVMISEIDTSFASGVNNGMSLKSMMNSADVKTADHETLMTFSIRQNADKESLQTLEMKLENRKIIRSLWSKYFTEPQELAEDSSLISDEQVWKNSFTTFFHEASNKDVRQLISDFILLKMTNHVPDVSIIPWTVIAQIGISGWPEFLEIENIWNICQSKVHLLAFKLDEMELCHNFAEEFERTSQKFNQYQNLQKAISYNIRGTISKQIGTFISNIPWKDLSRDDFVNWPEDIPVVYPVNLSICQKLKLNEVVKTIRLTDKALERIKTTASSGEVHDVRKEIILQLRLKLNDQLEFPVANVPWKSLNNGDILNWPEDVPLEYPNFLSSTQNKQILDHLPDMKFSEDFLKKMSASISKNRYYQGKTSSHIAKDLRSKLNDQMSSYISGVPWKDIKPGDIIGWPDDVPVKHPHQLNAHEKEKIILKMPEIKFTDEFLQRIKSKKVCLDFRKLVSNSLRSKLADQLGKVVAHIPWKELTLEDIAGWPAEIPIRYPNLLTANQNKKIMENIDNIFFTPEFIQKCKSKY
jgi:hypothetical protein